MKNERDPTKIKEAIEKGCYIVREIEALNQFHKYRTLRNRYESTNEINTI